MFTFSEEQTLLQEAARGFVQDRMTTAHARAVRDSQSADGFDRAMWAEMAAMGWMGVLIPEEHGGSDLGYVGLGVILEEMGKTLAPAPLHSTALIAASALAMGGGRAQKQAYWPKIAAGELIAALAVDEGPHHHPDVPQTRAERIGESYRLSGRKTYVADGHVADLMLVVADDGEGASLFLVPRESEGVTITPIATLDSRGAADISFENVTLELEARLGGHELVNQVLDRARIGLAAELMGLAQSAFDQTADYLKTRTQFGQLIGSFQGLQHRAAKMLVDLELTRSCVMAALAALDTGAEDKKIAELASLAKARAGETAHIVTNEMIQMHGGIGMTDAHDAGLFIKRARVLEHLYGGASFHRDRFATLAGI
jgi:alkylation response protein AidB-like acyl-CoA dehydrogenase